MNQSPAHRVLDFRGVWPRVLVGLLPSLSKKGTIYVEKHGLQDVLCPLVLMDFSDNSHHFSVAL